MLAGCAGAGGEHGGDRLRRKGDLKDPPVRGSRRPGEIAPGAERKPGEIEGAEVDIRGGAGSEVVGSAESGPQASKCPVAAIRRRALPSARVRQVAAGAPRGLVAHRRRGEVRCREQQALSAPPPGSAATKGLAPSGVAACATVGAGWERAGIEDGMGVGGERVDRVRRFARKHVEAPAWLIQGGGLRPGHRHRV